MDGEGSVHCWPGQYGKERRVGPQGGYPGRTSTAGSSSPPAPTGRYGKESRAGQYRRAQGQVGMGGEWVALTS